MLKDLIDRPDYLIPLALGHEQAARTGSSFSSLLGGQNKLQDGSSREGSFGNADCTSPPCTSIAPSGPALGRRECCWV